ncbi:GNAT family N-acetyltransferase [Vibrio profundum]|uniref:GNAT family N-acetyltransferase n=1 Tax=Vibrio profundum TaxID=2910247 RepID=UPI003D11AD2D
MFTRIPSETNPISINLKPIHSDEFDDIYLIVKQTLFTYIEQVYGWDEEFQRQRLSRDYQVDWYYWAYKGNKRIGLVCCRPIDTSYHLHLLIVFPEFQGQGVGKLLMRHIHQIARQNSKRQLTLSSFIANQGAVRFYQSLGYSIIEHEQHFVSMSADDLESHTLPKYKQKRPT